MQYSIEDLVRLAKRDNNSIRPYLYVNPLQGKHIPARPEETLAMCKALAGIVNNAYPEERLYVIGFAETATGIASAVCRYLDNVLYYQNTTREYKEGEEYLFFTESHSHATDQMLRSSGIENVINTVDRMIFIDDEVTTGNTICKLLGVIKKQYGIDNIKCSIVSILNSMPDSRVEELAEMGIDCLFLEKLPVEYQKDSILGIEYDEQRDTKPSYVENLKYETLCFEAQTNPRMINKYESYYAESQRFVTEIKDKLRNNHFAKMLVLGTEECMFPAIYLGEKLHEDGIADDVRVHATTRSPIIASGESNYPLYHRYQIKSLYDDLRQTYI